MATELGKAYVQIMPSAKGISKEITKTLDPEMKTAGKSAGSSIVSSIKKVIVAAGIGKVIATAVKEGGALQQSLGGVETLFKDHADRVKKYASEAYKTAGVSANEYMENVTSFSAALIRSLGGDTEKAAEIANMAMIDMADNMNKMGTPLRDIQNAYQGFAKQNYTMLDNLKLGYGGTKKEMKRLLADAQKLTGVKYDINNLADVYEAIHVIQKELGITGTTAKEATETLSGSFGALKAAFTDTLGAIALGEDIGPMLQNLSSTLITFLKNLLPMVSSTIIQIPQVIVSVLREAGPSFIQSGMQAISDLLTGLGQALPQLIPAAIDAILTLVSTFVNNLPMLIQSGINLMTGLAEGLINAIPVIIEKVPLIINSILTALTEQVPIIINAGIELFSSLVSGLPTIISNIVNVLPTIIENVINTIGTLVPLIIDAGVELFTSLVEELPTIINNIIAVLPDIIENIINTIGTLVPLIIDAGIKLLVALVDNLPAIINGIVEAIPIILDSIINALTNSIPLIIDAGVRLLTALVQNLPTIIRVIIATIPKIIDSIIKAVIKSIPLIVDAGIKLLTALVQNLPLIITTIIAAIPDIITSIINALVNNIPLVINAGVKLLTALITNLPTIIATLVRAMPQIISHMVSALGKGISAFAGVGLDLVKGLWNGIKNAGSWLENQIKGWAQGIVASVKSFFKIGSPSKLFADDVGKWLPAGLAEGIEDNVKPVTAAMEELASLTTGTLKSELALSAPDALDVGISSLNTREQEERLYRIIVKALTDGVRLEWNDRELGRLVRQFA